MPLARAGSGMRRERVKLSHKEPDPAEVIRPVIRGRRHQTKAPGLDVRQVKRSGGAKAREGPIQTHNPGYRPRHGAAILRETFQDDRIGHSLKQHKFIEEIRLSRAKKGAFLKKALNKFGINPAGIYPGLRLWTGCYGQDVLYAARGQDARSRPVCGEAPMPAAARTRLYRLGGLFQTPLCHPHPRGRAQGEARTRRA